MQGARAKEHPSLLKYCITILCVYGCVSVSVRVSVCVAFNAASDTGLGLNTQFVISNMHYSGNVRYSSKPPLCKHFLIHIVESSQSLL